MVTFKQMRLKTICFLFSPSWQALHNLIILVSHTVKKFISKGIFAFKGQNCGVRSQAETLGYGGSLWGSAKCAPASSSTQGCRMSAFHLLRLNGKATYSLQLIMQISSPQQKTVDLHHLKFSRLMSTIRASSRQPGRRLLGALKCHRELPTDCD